MAEYIIAEKDRCDRWEKMHARNNVAFDRIISKLEILLQHYNCSPSSSHGASNSPKHIPTSEPSNINLLMYDDFRSSAKQIKVPSVRESKLVEEEIIASELTNDSSPTTDGIGSIMEPIDAFDSSTVALPVSKVFLPSAEQIEEQSNANDSVDVRKLMAEVVTPMCEIISNPLVCKPHLNTDVSYAFSDASHQCIIHFDYTRSLEFPLVDFQSLKAVMVHLPNPLIMKSSSVFDPPLPKPPDLTQNAITNPAPPPEPPDNVTLSTLIDLMTEVFPSFSTSLAAQKLFGYLPHRNKINWSHIDSIYAQHSFNFLGVVLFFHFLKSDIMNPTEFILNHDIKVGTQWGAINHFLHLYGMVVQSVSIQHVCGGTFLIDFWANYGCSIEPNLSRAGHVTKIIAMWTTNSPQVKLMHCCVVWLAIDIVVSMVDAYIVHYCEMTLERNLFFFKEWIPDKSANTYYNFIAANWCTTHFIAHIPFTQDFHFTKSIFSKILNWRFVNGLSFESFVVTFGLTNLAKVCDYNCSSTLIAHSFGYLINGYLLQIYAKSVIMLLKVLIGKHSMERIKGIIASCCKPIMQYQQGGSTTNIGGVAYFFISKKVFTQNAKEANYILEERLWYKLGFIIEYHFDGAACFVSALVQELEKSGDACLFHAKQFIQWDPGRCFIVHVEVATIILHHFLDFNLEDKVCLHRGDSDMIHVVWIPCVLAWMIDNEGTINDIKAVEIMEKIKHKKIARLHYCFIVLDGSLVAKLVAFGVTKIVTYGCQFMHIIVRICGCTSQVKMERRKKWDPGRHSNMHTTTWSTKFKQWDPGKIGVVSNCYNLEDKVGFKGEGIVMNPPYWIGPNRS